MNLSSEDLAYLKRHNVDPNQLKPFTDEAMEGQEDVVADELKKRGLTSLDQVGSQSDNMRQSAINMASGRIAGMNQGQTPELDLNPPGSKGLQQSKKPGMLFQWGG